MQFCLDKHGEWVVVSANDDDKEEDEEDAFFGAKNEQQVKKIARTLADATTWLDMLNDTQRNIMFQRAVENCIGKTNSQKNELTVFDVGSGTGLLSLFAARAKTLSEKTFVKILLVRDVFTNFSSRRTSGEREQESKKDSRNKFDPYVSQKERRCRCDTEK